MVTPEEEYQKQVIRARFEWMGVPSRDRWDRLEPIELEVAEAMVEESGEQAFVGDRVNGLETLDLATVGFLVTLDDAFPDRQLSQDNVDEIVEEVVRPGFSEMSQRTESAVEGGINDAIVKTAQGHRNGLNNAAQAAGVEVSDDAIREMVERVKARTQGRRVASDQGSVVLRKVYTEAAESTESFIRDNVGQPGRKTARTLLKDLGNHPRIRQALENEGPRGQRVRRAIQRAGVAGDEINAPGRNMYVNAKRAMAHELTQAQHEADVLTAQESPAVKALMWRVSARHPSLKSSPDVCDVLETADVHGLGEGLYMPGATPSLPHPFCECAVIPETVPPEKWGEIEYNDDQVPNTEPREVTQQEAADKMRARLTADSGPVTAASVRRATEAINQRTAIAFDEFVDF